MSAQMVRVFNRGKLWRDVERGLLEARCDMRLTDDYAFDNANKFGKMSEFKPCCAQEFKLDERTGRKMRSHKEGFVEFEQWEFQGKSGYAWLMDDGTIHFAVHSNLWYTLRYKKDAAKQE